MPIIGIDCRFGSALAGLGTFTRNLVAELTARNDGCTYALFVKSLHEEWVQPYLRKGYDIREAPFPHYSFQEQTDLPNLIQDAQCVLFHSPQFNVPFFCPVPFTCTVHDLILHRFPNEASAAKRLAYRFLMHSALKHAEHVFAVSEATKADIASTYGSGVNAKTSVTYPGVSSEFSAQPSTATSDVVRRYGLEQPFLLYVGNCKEHKNVATLLDAFERANLTGIDLVCVSGGIESAKYTRRTGVHFLPTVPPSDLPAFYSASIGTVTATLMEGFCLPLVEAMACRSPVLATNVGPIPEVCGKHALLVKPTVSDLAEGMRLLVRDPSLRSNESLEASRQWAARFTWKTTAAKTADTFREILKRLS